MTRFRFIDPAAAQPPIERPPLAPLGGARDSEQDPYDEGAADPRDLAAAIAALGREPQSSPAGLASNLAAQAMLQYVRHNSLEGQADPDSADDGPGGGGYAADLAAAPLYGAKDRLGAAFAAGPSNGPFSALEGRDLGPAVIPQDIVALGYDKAAALSRLLGKPTPQAALQPPRALVSAALDPRNRQALAAALMALGPGASPPAI
jgi:hypothetical protein